jgi:hypothetical protein
MMQLFRYLIEQDAINAYWRVEVELHTFVTSAPRWSSVVSFTPGEKARSTLCAAKWAGLRAGVNGEEKEDVSCCCQNPAPFRWSFSL